MLAHRSRQAIGLVTILALFVSGMIVASAQTESFSNAQAISIAEIGSANPYPSTITVTGMTGTIIDVNVSLTGISHGYPLDIDLLLVGPDNQAVILMDDVGNAAPVSDVDITFDDAATESLTETQTLASGTYKPSSNLFVGGSCPLTPFPSPAPEGPYGATLTELNGGNPNGSWSLFVQDDCDGDGGSIAGGWSLEIVTDTPEISVPDDIVVANDPGQAGAVVTYPAATATDVEDGELTPTCSQASGIFFPLGTTTVECTVTDSDLNEVSDSFTVTVNDTEPPVLTTADITVPATSPAGAIVTYTPTATDNSGQPVTIDCTPVSGTLFAPGTTLVECDLTDNASNSTTDTFAVTVLESSDLLAELRAATIAHVDNPLYERWMTQMLDVSRFALERGRPEIAQLYLRIYDIQLTLGKAIRQISSDDAAELRLLLNQVRDAMS